jgi:hypothetical protein
MKVPVMIEVYPLQLIFVTGQIFIILRTKQGLYRRIICDIFAGKQNHLVGVISKYMHNVDILIFVL